MASEAVECNGSERRLDAMTIVLSNQTTGKSMPLKVEMLHLAWYKCRCYQNSVLSALSFLLASTNFLDNFFDKEWEILSPRMKEVFTTLILLVFDFSALSIEDPFSPANILPSNDQFVLFAEIMQRESPQFTGELGLRDTYGNPENFLRHILDTDSSSSMSSNPDNHISQSFFKSLNGKDSVFRIHSGNGGKQTQLQHLIREAKLDEVGSFETSCPQQFLVMRIVHAFEVPSSHFSNYLKAAYTGFPFVLSTI